MALLDFWSSLKLISHEILVAEKLQNFHTVKEEENYGENINHTCYHITRNVAIVCKRMFFNN